MSELRQRFHQEGEVKKEHEDTPVFDKADKAPDKGEKSDEDEDEEVSREMGVSAPTELSQGTDKTTEALDEALKDLTPRWRNWVIRGIFTWLMIFGFAFIIYLGPLALVTLILGLQIKCFHEIITIGYVVYRSYDLPWFRTLSWYFLFASNYFFYGESFIDHFGVLLHRTDFLVPFVTYHRIISFTLYCSGIVGFVFSLKKKYYLKQFTMFGWTHVTLLLVVTQSHLIMQNIFEGLIWFLVPVSMIICNDIMAYMFGFFFGKTPLIKLSPKKTWEGFIGGALSTIIFGIVFSYWLSSYDFLVCPISYDEVMNQLTTECEKNPVFILTEYQLPLTLQGFFAFVRIPWRTIHLYPFMLHSILMSVFASVIGPFGGFFASGFKRAFKIKDFGDTIPGHGGIMDRFDCQFLMATFVHVYHFSFIRVPNSQRILQSILLLPAEEQLQVFNMLEEKLLSRGLLNVTSTS